MAAPTIYRSTDTGAPVLTAQLGSIVNLLDKVLVNGYGSTRATGTITSNGTNVSNNDTVTLDGTTYTFKTALTPAANEVLIGASAAASLTNLVAAMCGFGTAGTTYGTGTTQQTNVQVTNLTATVITLQAFTGGTGGNSLAIAKSAATLTLSGATLSGGGGSDTTSSLGWGKPFAGTFKGSYRAASGVRQYLDVDDSGPNSTALGRNFVVRGYETMSAVGTGTGPFPTVAQVTTAVGLVKSTTLTQVARPWLLIGDGLTFYLFVESAGTDPPVLSSHTWTSEFCFGEILSALVGDLYRTFITYQSTTATVVTAGEGSLAGINVVSGTNSTAVVNFNIPRAYTGAGGGIWAAAIGCSYAMTGNTGSAPLDAGLFTFPNAVDGGLYCSAIDVFERGNGAAAVACASSNGVRGRMRGFYTTHYNTTGWDDQNTFTGTGDFAGITFICLKGANGMVAFATTAWAASS